ncbi:MAG: prolyl oligopeptidase family serine peptidase [Phycisphaerae bacterium]|nr:prolyl oligopeptidase family serine peptidase [Phycisphaerae bacterium]
MTPGTFRTLAILFWLFATIGPHALAEPAAMSQPAASEAITFETVTLAEGGPTATLEIAFRPSPLQRRPVILMMGSLEPRQLPPWSEGLLAEGFMLAAFRVAHEPDADPAKRPQWLFFDQRFAHSYVLGGYRAPQDAGRVIDYLVSRGDVNPDKIGWLGSSSTGIPGLAVATREPRLAAIVAFVSTGAYRQWLETWHTNGLWRGETKDLWPETEALLKHDPILHVETMYPTAVLMVSGGADKVVDPRTARAFVEAARPYYARDPDRLRLVVYEGFGHNLPIDVVRMYAEHWFRLYLHPTRPPPKPPAEAANLRESADRTRINAADHQDVVGAK